jgi:GrpB-like predicted nucleotidyltransferase (UPF0157 family)
MSNQVPTDQEIIDFRYQYFPYQTEYSHWADEEIQRLALILPSGIEVIHFGSTAVPGLSGKRIIDLMLVVSVAADQLSTEPTNLITLLEAQGYSYRPQVRIDEQRWFLQRFEFLATGGMRGFHAHVVQVLPGSTPWEIAFRDYMRTHPDDCARYEAVKQRAVIAARQEVTKEAKKQAYIQTKDPVIEEIMAKIAQEHTG